MSLFAPILMLMKLWLAIGLLFGIAFVVRGINRVDSASASSKWGLRLILIPGCLVFWPRLLQLWVRGVQLPTEQSSHRNAATEEA